MQKIELIEGAFESVKLDSVNIKKLTGVVSFEVKYIVNNIII